MDVKEVVEHLMKGDYYLFEVASNECVSGKIYFIPSAYFEKAVRSICDAKSFDEVPLLLLNYSDFVVNSLFVEDESKVITISLDYEGAGILQREFILFETPNDKIKEKIKKLVGSNIDCVVI